MKLTSEVRLIEITGEPYAYSVGRTWVCDVCGTRVRQGQPHRTNVYPAHATLAAIIVHERLDSKTPGRLLEVA